MRSARVWVVVLLLLSLGLATTVAAQEGEETGVILSMPAGPTLGSILGDNGQTYPFDEDVAPLGLGVASACQFDVQLVLPIGFMAVNIAPLGGGGGPPPIIISSNVQGGLVINVSETVTVTSGAKITGAVTVTGGSLTLEQGSQIQGDVTISAGGTVMVTGFSQIKGAVELSGGSSLEVNGSSKIKGEISGQHGHVSITGSQIMGNLVVEDPGSTISISGSQIFGSVTSVAASLTLDDTMVTGELNTDGALTVTINDCDIKKDADINDSGTVIITDNTFRADVTVTGFDPTTSVITDNTVLGTQAVEPTSS